MVTDVVADTVATYDPLAAFHELVVESQEFCADMAVGSNTSGDVLAEPRGNLLRLVGYKIALQFIIM